ncbi:unnamed protein product [Rangifer tarandus platyrhynchus]|uniref:Uncharacterized protein n=1 Tax=Rangifer tarandus platyrhynchus TaxID=3082113 RepID=A0AC60A414_RANTA
MALLLQGDYLSMSVSKRLCEDAVGDHGSHRELLLTETIFRTLQPVIVHFHSQRLSHLREQKKLCLPYPISLQLAKKFEVTQFPANHVARTRFSPFCFLRW